MPKSHRSKRLHHSSPHNGKLRKLKKILTHKTSDLISGSVKATKHGASAFQHNVAHYVTKNPYKSLGIAAVAASCMGYYFLKK